MAQLCLEEDLGVPMDSLRIVYEINGEFSCDIAHGVTENWTQRHNPFLGKGLNGSAVLDFIERVHGHRILFAMSNATSPPTGVLFSLFNYPRGYSGEHCCVEKAFTALGRLLGEKTAPCVIEAADETFNIHGVSFATEFGKSAIETSARVHYRAIYLPLAPNTFASDGVLYTCCEMHRCVSYVASPTAASRSVVKEYWFYQPLTWLDAACGVHDDAFFFTARGMKYKAIVPSPLTELEMYGKTAASFLPGSDAHLRLIPRLQSVSTSILRRFFKMQSYAVPVISELLIAWSERSKGAETVAEILEFIKTLASAVPYAELDAFLQAMYSRFASEWLCTHVSLFYTAFLAQLLQHRCRHLRLIARVVRGVPDSVRRIITSFCRPANIIQHSETAIEVSILTLNDYMWAEPWWYKAVLSNVSSVFQNSDGGNREWSLFIGIQMPVFLGRKFILEATRWRSIITDSHILERYDVIVKALHMGGDPFEFIKSIRSHDVTLPYCNPAAIAVLCALSMSADRVLAKWSRVGNTPAFMSFMNMWTPLLQGYEHAACIFSRISHELSARSDESEDLSEHWRNVLQRGKWTDNKRRKLDDVTD